MGVPVISSTSPEDSDTNVYRNAVISVVFSEALDPDTVNTGTFLLRNVDSNELMDVQVSLSDDGLTVTIIPVIFLAQETIYSLTIVGEDVGGDSDSVESSSTNDELVTTLRVLFTVGNEIEAGAIEKTHEQIEAEGDLSLPSDVEVVEDTDYLKIVDTIPNNRAFNIDRDFSSVTVEFDGTIDSSTISDTTFKVEIEAYYPEDEFFLAQPSDDGLCNFQFQEHTDEDGELYTYGDPTGTLTVTGTLVTWTADDDVVFPANSRVKVILSKAISDTDGRHLDANRTFVFYLEMCPNVVSVESVRDLFYPLPQFSNCTVNNVWTDDIIGKTIYKNLMDVLPRVHWEVKWTKVYPRLREYVLYKTQDDIFRMMTAESDLVAGQFKKLGDLTIKYDFRSTGVIPQAQKKAIERYRRALEELTARFLEFPKPFIKGYENPEQRQYWRNRLWQIDIARAYQGYSVVGARQGNTRTHRATKVPGWFDTWR